MLPGICRQPVLEKGDIVRVERADRRLPAKWRRHLVVEIEAVNRQRFPGCLVRRQVWAGPVPLPDVALAGLAVEYHVVGEGCPSNQERGYREKEESRLHSALKSPPRW